MVDEEKPEDKDNHAESLKAHAPDILLNTLSALRLGAVLLVIAVTSTNFFKENKSDTWPKSMRLGVSVTEFIYVILGLIAFIASILNDHKRQNIGLFIAYKVLELAFSLVAASLIISDLLDKDIRNDVGFIFLCVSFFISKFSDITYMEKSYGGLRQLMVLNKGQANFDNAGNFNCNISCCPYGFYYSRTVYENDNSHENEYSFALMSDLHGSSEHSEARAKKGIIYIDLDTRMYLVLGEKGEQHESIIPGETDLRPLIFIAEHLELKKQVLDYISRQGHIHNKNPEISHTYDERDKGKDPESSHPHHERNKGKDPEKVSLLRGSPVPGHS